MVFSPPLGVKLARRILGTVLDELAQIPRMDATGTGGGVNHPFVGPLKTVKTPPGRLVSRYAQVPAACATLMAH